MPYPLPIAAITALALTGTAAAQTAPDTSQISTHVGEMQAEMGGGRAVLERLRFEPYQLVGDMFARDDVVYLMRHGPTDWSKLDVANVAPTDCANQRVMTPEGAEEMQALGTILGANGIVPSRIVVSEWCRNQQTLDHLMAGFSAVDPAIAEAMPVETSADLNLLLSLQGAKNVTALRDTISTWDGDPDRRGPLLLITHFTNIEELTQFGVFEGEILVLDPKRDNQVLGTIRLKSASPDVGHFANALESPLLHAERAMDMMTRYYAALNTGNEDAFRDMLSDRWVGHGTSPALPDQDASDFLAELSQYTDGLSDARFQVDDIHLAEDIVTVIGTITGRHTAELFGVPATGRTVSFGGIAVHRIADGAIVESWQMADRAVLMDQIQ